MSSETANLKGTIESLGIAVDVFDREADPEFFQNNTAMVARLTGGCLGSFHALLKASRDVCTVSLWMPPPSLEITKEIAVSLLRLNFAVPFGRVSLASYERRSKKVDWIFAETMFFWRNGVVCQEPFKEEIHKRLVGLVNLYNQVQIVVAPKSQKPRDPAT